MAGMRFENFKRYFLIYLGLLIIAAHIDAQCSIPTQFRGDFFSIERGADLDTNINEFELLNQFFNGICQEKRDSNITDADGNHDSHILFFDQASACYKCYEMGYRTPNLIQYKQSTCRTFESVIPTLDEVCGDIQEFTGTSTFFRKTMVTVNCKNTFEGVFHFTYEWDIGGGGICNSGDSVITACQEPGSPYVDNQVFNMNYGRCSDVTTSANMAIRFQCMGTWTDANGNVWSGVADLGRDVYRERFRCMLTRHDQEEAINRRRFTMSWWADCSTLKSPYDGPVRLMLEPVLGVFQLAQSNPTCNFPDDYYGSWYHSSELDVYADFNKTHMYFKTVQDQFSYKETYFACMMTTGNRYMTVALTVGKCEIDYVCFELLPRHHSIIRWRMAKPYRLTEIEMAYPDHGMYMFRQACFWSSFTLDRSDINWNYRTFLLSPPQPVPCPIQGRYMFEQRGPESELIKTRIRGMTERPRHMIDCRHYVTEFKACSDNPTILSLDAEYCETVDHTGRPIGEYDEADWELTCVGFWDEDWNSYMITYDLEDATSNYRCWNYERTDWRHIKISRSTGAACIPAQGSDSDTPEEGVSLAMFLTEHERLFDDCPQDYLDGDPWDRQDEELGLDSKSGQPLTCHMFTLCISLGAVFLHKILTLVVL